MSVFILVKGLGDKVTVAFLIEIRKYIRKEKQKSKNSGSFCKESWTNENVLQDLL